MVARITTAIVLAAGFGKRMRPLTDSRPKPLVPLAGRALLDHVLDRLAVAGVSLAVVNGHYFAELIEAHVAGRVAHGVLPTLMFSDERAQLLDTGGGVVKAMALLDRAAGPQPVLIHNSDSVWIEPPEMRTAGCSNLDRLIASFDPSRMDCALLLAPTKGSLGYDGRGDFDLQPDGRISRPAPGQPAAFVFAGASIAGRALLADAPVGPFSLADLWHRAVDQGRAYGLPMRGLWMHVGDPAALMAAEVAIASAGGIAPLVPPDRS